jgi:hypothetical protein
MAAGEWNAAKMAVARWLAVAPEDQEAQRALARIKQGLEDVSVKTASPQMISAQETASSKTSIPSEPEDLKGDEPTALSPSRRRGFLKHIPVWLWIGGGAIGLLGIGLLTNEGTVEFIKV